MAFNNTVLADNPDLGAGEVLYNSPHNVSVFEQFEDGLVEGRFCKYDTGQADNLDGSATPTIAGIVKRKITGEIGEGVYSTSGREIDQVAEVINFGWATVTVTDAASPAKYGQVYTVNDGTTDAGKATSDSGELEVPGCVFWEEKATNVWLVRVIIGMELTTAYVASLPSMSLTVTDNEDGSATLDIQAKKPDGSDYEDNVMFRVWRGTADDFGADALGTGVSFVTGTQIDAMTADADYRAITDSTGTADVTLDNGGAAASNFVWVEVGGNIYSTGEFAITA